MEATKPRVNSYVLFIIGFLAIALKLPYITAPISDWHSWNQISVMAMTRYIYQEGWSAFWQPKVDLFENLSLVSNYAFAEFPIFEGIIAVFYRLFSREAEWIARMVALCFSVLGTQYFYLLVTEESDERTGRIAVGMYLISPMVWYFHRTVMTDVVMVNLIIAGVYHFRKWLSFESYGHLFACTLFTACAALAKAYGLYIGVAYLLLILERWGWRRLFHPGHFILLIGACTPILGWIWCGLGEASAATGRNLTGTTELLGPISIWWDTRYWLRLQSSIMDFTLLPLGNIGFIAGLVNYKRLWSYRLAFHWMVAVIFYFLFVRQGNMAHDYYQMPFTAPVIFVAAIGWSALADALRNKVSSKQYRLIVGTIAVLCIINGAKYSYTKAKLDWSPVHLGEKIDALATTGEYAIIIDSDGLQRNQVLFYAKTHGWHFRSPPSLEAIEPYIKSGARWIALNMDENDYLQFKVLLEKYDDAFVKVWEDFSTNRYKKRKRLLVYRTY